MTLRPHPLAITRRAPDQPARREDPTDHAVPWAAAAEPHTARHDPDSRRLRRLILAVSCARHELRRACEALRRELDGHG